MEAEETSGFLDEENNSDIDDEKIDQSKTQLLYSPFQLVGDIIGCMRSLVRLSVIFTGLWQHCKWERYSFFIIELLIIYTSSTMQLLRRDRTNGHLISWSSRFLILIGPIYSTFGTIYYHLKCIYHGIWVYRGKKMNLHGKYLHIAMESLARKCALYWMTEDALLLGTSTLFLTLAHQADWLEFPIPNKFFLTKSINQVCGEATTITSLNVPEWVLCFVRKLLPFFGYWPMDYLFITRVWILLWSCMWACDFLDFSWTLFVYPPVKGKRFRPGPLPQLHRAANQLLELGFRAFGIVLSGSVMVPMIFRSLTPDQVYQDRKIYLNALYNKGYEHYGANVSTINQTADHCTPNPYDDCDRYTTVRYSISKDIHDVRKVANVTLLRRDSYSDLLQAVNGSILIYCLLVYAMTLFFHIMVEYGRWSSIRAREFHVVLQKSVLFAPYSRYAWKKRPQSSSRFRTVYVSIQLVSIPCLFGLLCFTLQDIDYDGFRAQASGSLNNTQLWHLITESRGYPGGVFNYGAKFFNYYLETNIFICTLLPSLLFFVFYAVSVNIYFKVLNKVRNYEFSLYRTKYTTLYGAYR